jgi:hypothetical protein
MVPLFIRENVGGDPIISEIKLKMTGRGIEKWR